MAGLQLSITIIASFMIVLVSSEKEADYCYAQDDNPYIYTGTKTPYHFVHGLVKNSSVPNCEPMQIWMLCRHGTRYPSKSEIKNILNKLPDLQKDIINNHGKRGSGSLCDADLDNLKAWKLNPKVNEENGKHLVEQGEIDLKSLGSRYKDYYPELLHANPTEDISKNYKFRSTNSQRTILSMESFIKGAFGERSNVQMQVEPEKDDQLLVPYKTCPTWLEEMNKTETNQEHKKFISGPQFTRLISDVSRRLGFPNNLTLDNVWTMYTMCIFEKAWKPDANSPWCAVFTKAELKIFEYEDDLYHYYHTGYGEKLSSKIGCPSMKDMFEHFSKLENGGSLKQPRGIFYFAHSATLQTFYTAMGIAKDDVPPTASNFGTIKDRKWRVSFIGPFAANFVAISYRCDNAMKIRFFLNEKPFAYEGCEGNVCDWEFVKGKLQDSVSACNLNFC